jgi:hypothetical protein
MKKIFFLIIVLFAIGALFYVSFHAVPEININWTVNLPVEDKLIYHEDSLDEDDIRFFGEGLEYTVLEYNNKRKIDKLSRINWVSSKNQEIEIKALKIIDEIKVDSKYMIDFTKEYQYFYEEKNKVDFIIIFYQKEDNVIYIVEQKT